MVSQFYGREAELGVLEDIYRSLHIKAGFAVIYGRRRVGKTELAKKFAENKKSLWLFVEPKSDALILQDFEKEAEAILGIRPKFETWDDFFRFIFLQENIIVIFDEFQNFSATGPHIFSKIQKYWDDYHRKSKIMLIAIGSYVGIMKRLFYDKKEPLFGRADVMINLKPFNFMQTCEFFEHFGIKKEKEEAMKIYSLFGGVPKYLLYPIQFRLKTAEDMIKYLFLNPPGILAEEGTNILVLEFGSEHRGYFSILEAISLGKVLPREIADYTHLEKDTVAKYLHELHYEYEIIKKEIPVTEDKTRDVRYFIRDNFFRFWFRFIYRNRGRIEINRDDVHNEVMSGLNTFFGRTFEDVAYEFIPTKGLDFTIEKIGRWWHKDKEIDLLALNDKTKDIAFFEVKWQNLDKNNAKKILEGLKNKSLFVGWNLGKRKELFGIIAKKIKEKDSLRKDGFLAFDLDDFE